MAAAVHLAVDLGAETGRVVAGILEGERLILHEMHRFENHPCRLATGSHWNVPGLFADVLEGVRRTVTWSGAMRLDLTSVGVDTWGVDYALLSESGELLGLPHCYRDERNLPAFEKTLAVIGEEALYEATGIQFMPLNTLCQLVAAADADRALVEGAAGLLFMPDLMHHLLSGSLSVEATIASTSQMLDARSGRWAHAILERLGLPTRCLGDIVPPGTRLGSLREELLEQVGAGAAGPEVVAPASHDTASAVAAVPADPATSWCYISSGTWSLLGAEIDGPCLSDAARAAPFTNERGLGGTVRFLKNITGLWLVQEVRRHFAQVREDYKYDELTARAAEAEPFRTLVDTDHPAFAQPGHMPQKLNEYAAATGQPSLDDPGALVRCCLESLALTYRRTLHELEEVLGRRFDVVHVVGGGARNRLLNQMTADATGRRVAAGPVEATAAGNALVQAMACGTVRDRAHLRTIVAASTPPKLFEPRGGAEWERANERWREIIASPRGARAESAP